MQPYERLVPKWHRQRKLLSLPKIETLAGLFGESNARREWEWASLKRTVQQADMGSDEIAGASERRRSARCMHCQHIKKGAGNCRPRIDSDSAY